MLSRVTTGGIKMKMKELLDSFPPLVEAEKARAPSMTNAKRLRLIGVPLIRDLLDTGKPEPHPGQYKEITCDDSDYSLCVATGQGNHGKGAKLHKNAEKRIRRVRENIQSMLRFVDVDEFAAFLAERDLTQDEFVELVMRLPSASRSEETA